MKADANEVLRHLQNPSDRRRETRTALLQMLKDGPVLGEGRPEQLDLKEAALGRLRDKLHIVSVKDPADAMHGAYCASALVVLAYHRRRVVHFNVTEHPTPAWTAQQLVDAFPDDSAPAYLLRGRDRVDGQPFRHRVKGMGSRLLTAPQSPWQNPFVERLIGSIRRERLNHVLLLGDRHLRRILTRYLAYYHQARAHLALDKDAPDLRPIEFPAAGRIVQLPEVGGLHHRYIRQAA